MVVNWTNEEGARFAPAMLSSGVWAGAFARDYAYGRTDRDGKRFGDELERIGYRGPCPAAAGLAVPLRAAHRAGPGARGRGQGDRGRHRRPGHPLVRRHDHRQGEPFRLDPDADAQGRPGRGRQGDRRLRRDRPPPRPARRRHGRRHPHRPALAQRHPGRGLALGRRPPPRRPPSSTRSRPRSARPLAAACARDGLPHQVDRIWDLPPVAFDPSCVAAVRNAAQEAGYPWREMISGPGHDSFYTARRIPTSMIFIPCRDGLSHNEEEWAEPEHLEAGANVLLRAVLEMAAGCQYRGVMLCTDRRVRPAHPPARPEQSRPCRERASWTTCGCGPCGASSPSCSRSSCRSPSSPGGSRSSASARATS